MVLSDPPAITMHTIYKCEPGLYRSAILECESINARVDCKLTKGAYVGFINGSYRILLKKVGKIIFDFFVSVADPVGHCRQQDGVAGIQVRYMLRISGLQCIVPLIKEGSNFDFNHL